MFVARLVGINGSYFLKKMVMNSYIVIIGNVNFVIKRKKKIVLCK